MNGGKDQNTGGIWNDVLLNITNHLFIQNVKVNSKINYDKNTSHIQIDCSYLSNLKKQLKDKVKIEITSPSKKKITKTFDVEIQPKSNQCSFEIEIRNPELWWSWDLGRPDLYDLKNFRRIFWRASDQIWNPGS